MKILICDDDLMFAQAVHDRLLEFCSGAGTVSYTHLDVYKRQVLRPAERRLHHAGQLLRRAG